jgi:ATP-binding cassette subfamily B multidrug efflux pump
MPKSVGQGVNAPAGRMSEYVTNKKRKTLRRLLVFFFHHKGLFFLSLLLAALVNLVQVAKPYILRMIIDYNLAIGLNDMSKIGLWAVIYLGVTLAGVTMDYSQALVLSSLGQRIMHTLRTRLFAHIQRMNMQFFDRNSSGSLLTRVNSDIESLSDLYSGIVVAFIKDILLIGNIMGAMILLNVELALWSFLCIPVVAVLTFAYRYFARRNFIRLKAQLSRLNGFLAENINGMRIVQIFAREKEKNAEFGKLGKEYYRLGMVEIILNSLSNPLLNALSHLFAALLLMFFAPRTILGGLEIGTLYAFVLYIKQFFNPVSNLADQFTSIQSSLISADRVFDIIDKEDSLEDLDEGEPISAFSGRIEFKNVWFAYVDENWVLKDISFTIEPGQNVAFVGATGSGKSTIISLLARFYEIQKGEILIDGKDIRQYKKSDLRRCISVVQQDVFLFTGDINYNIRLNDQTITDADIVQAAKTVGAHPFIKSLPGGYTSYVAERGAEFSAGQRQLVAFARAIAVKPSVLILDEATASIDTETEQALSQAMKAVSDQITTITVAHRLSTIVHCDQIFVLDHGTLIERGTHDELLAFNDHYANLYRLSLAAQEEEKWAAK